MLINLSGWRDKCKNENKILGKDGNNNWVPKFIF